MLRILAIIIILSSFGMMMPGFFSQKAPYIPILLGLVMFSMGMTLVPQDFLRVTRKWKLVLLGTILQFTLMPLIAWGLSKVFALPLSLTIGMVLVGCSPGGTASNVMVFLGKGNVPLSISLTLVSTLLSPVVTPGLIQFWLGETVSFNAYLVFVSIAKIVVAPILLGMTVNRFLKELAALYVRYASIISAAAIGLIIAIVLAINREMLVSSFPILIFVAVILHNGLGYLFGYGSAILLSKNEQDARTIAIEVGMQNSGLAVTLAQQFFSQYALSSLPGAIFSFWHNLSGLGLAFLFNKKR